jgi:hypothetical protein
MPERISGVQELVLGLRVSAMMQNPDSVKGTPVPLERVHLIASMFDLHHPFQVADFPEKGNINRQTFLVTEEAPADPAEYILQEINPEVFKQPRRVMDSMISCIGIQQKALLEGRLRAGEEWETIRLIPTRDGRDYLEIPGAEGMQCWRMMARIRQARTHKSLSEVPDSANRLRIAEEAGKGLALFGALTEGMDPDAIVCPLPGYRDTALYYYQLRSVLDGNRTAAEAAACLPSDPVLRQSTEPQFLVHLSAEDYRLRREDPQLSRYITLALDQRSYGLTLCEGLRTGRLKKGIIHGDTKLDNFLFSTQTGRVKALVDLDTVMPHTWLADWGDMARSLTNIAGERARDFDAIDVDLEIFKAMARGFIGTACHIAAGEMELMVDAVRIMALELGVRFLADYLRGDNYFKLDFRDPGDLNKTRALVQFSVFKSFGRKSSPAKKYILDLLEQRHKEAKE